MHERLRFDDTIFDVVDRQGQPWLRQPQIGKALGYLEPAKKIHELYNRHADEFSKGMTALVRVPDVNPHTGGAGQVREVRVFSLRGAHLLGMLARTDRAKDFRRWVLDVLEQNAQALPQTTSPAIHTYVHHHAGHIADATDYFGNMLHAAETIKMSQRRTVLAANQATLQYSGIDMLATLGVSPDELDDTPTAPATPAAPTPMEDDTFASQLQRWLAEPAQARRRQFTSNDIMLGLCGAVPPANQRALATRIGQVMVRLGWPKRRLPPDAQGYRAWVYCRRPN